MKQANVGQPNLGILGKDSVGTNEQILGGLPGLFWVTSESFPRVPYQLQSVILLFILAWGPSNNQIVMANTAAREMMMRIW